MLARAVSQPRSVLAGLGEPTEVGIHTLYRAPDLTILNVIWAPMMVLLPHDHRMWATIGIYTGREDNILWNRSGEFVQGSSATAIAERQVFDLPDTAIHSVINPIPRLTGAIHIYGGDFLASRAANGIQRRCTSTHSIFRPRSARSARQTIASSVRNEVAWLS